MLCKIDFFACLLTIIAYSRFILIDVLSLVLGNGRLEYESPMVVNMEINGMMYQGVLFAQHPRRIWRHHLRTLVVKIWKPRPFRLKLYEIHLQWFCHTAVQNRVSLVWIFTHFGRGCTGTIIKLYFWLLTHILCYGLSLCGWWMSRTAGLKWLLPKWGGGM